MTNTSCLSRSLGENFREFRKRKGLKQHQLAELSGITRALISEVENGKRNTTLDTLEKMMRGLDITPQELFDFGQLSSVHDITDKKILIDSHRDFLNGRDVEEVRYIAEATKKLFNMIDNK